MRKFLVDGDFATLSSELTDWMGDSVTPASADMEIYSDTHNEVVHTETLTPAAGSVDFDFHAGKYQGPGDYEVNITYEIEPEVSKTNTAQIKVFVPYVSMNLVETSEHTSGMDDDEKLRLAYSINRIIDNFTNNWFGKHLAKTVEVRGQQNKWLNLPERMWEFTSIESSDFADDVIDRHALFDMDTVTLRRGYEYQLKGSRPFTDKRMYKVLGNWGWRTVPMDVNTAANKLFEIKFCNDSVYRDRWLESINAGDWTMDFVRTGSKTTGSAEVDLILQNFRNLGMHVA